MQKVVCFSCHQEMQFSSVIGRGESCSKCRADVHVCKNCQHYDAKAYNECREPVAEVVREKDRANFCDQFVANNAARSAGKSAADLRAAAEALFKKKS